MTTLVKHAIITFLTLLVGSNHKGALIGVNENPMVVAVPKDPKKAAFQILENKCNVCHNVRNKRRVFTPENMNTWANDIYTQVYIKKRMPKGKKIKLTSTEYQDLLTWISSPKTNQNGSKL
ncbi:MULTISPECIES: hypothetical protein [Maribacter]|uniref:Cytochrome c n=1 Tax=Maribacter flavus TaxID=1658664 RepID=A0A5B2TST2_9FLAO|nr:MULTISPECIES: hypothetical protein [Maribacter]KAA2217203.1 hypothetical protein F0361_14675 [Maribacter flavus]MDC6407085.1 hypothetical protein [Maribacter sp. PR66]MEE1974232.1 hypothetical protein [Maribacter flavus]